MDFCVSGSRNSTNDQFYFKYCDLKLIEHDKSTRMYA